jgi:tRNA (adenine57-N1/adenine58-N1)-methyltransferase
VQNHQQDTPIAGDEEVTHEQTQITGTYASRRRAVIHTLDISAEHSAHAQKVARNFRRGLYSSNIEFHVGTIPDYLSQRLSSSNGQPFLEHAFLDLPSTHSYLEIVGQALKPNGSFLAFCPSITQINTCVKAVKEQNLPFVLETVLEIGQGAGVGGRLWDVRAVKPRAVLKAEAEARELEESQASETLGDTSEAGPNAALSQSEAESSDKGWEMICRPKVGERVIGGGFVALWRRMEQ